MPRQIILLRRRVVAAGYGAFVRLLARVRAHVLRQMTLVGKQKMIWSQKHGQAMMKII